MKKFNTFKEELGAGASIVGSGQIAGAGIGSQGEPGVPAGITTTKRKSDFPKKKIPVMGMFNRKPPKN
jgi:hypothetical protein